MGLHPFLSPPFSLPQPFLSPPLPHTPTSCQLISARKLEGRERLGSGQSGNIDLWFWICLASLGLDYID